MGDAVEAWTTVAVADETRLDELMRFLEASGCRVRSGGANAAEVLHAANGPGELTPLELDLYLRLWEASSGGYAYVTP